MPHPARPTPSGPEARVLITAGPTHEPIDAVRYIANRSSGRLGIALAEEASTRAAQTTLLLGPTHLQPRQTSHLSVIRFRTTADLQRLLHEHWPAHDVLIMAAAVADYRVPKTYAGKLKRSADSLTLTLEPTPDLLAGLRPLTRPQQRTIGFALAPTEHLRASASRKLAQKGLEAIVANPLETMDAHTITAVLLRRDGSEASPPAAIDKREFARWLLDELGL